ncbi:TIGR04222 domain-containing membrane protein [Streptomyces sp. NPDC006602]|uniref:TIGR04222 domain-containing membrane protein n=1 Tax=Streptomyces sp. NPDC006602 TaxID=3364751 RepID=UPI0036A55405
MAGRRPRRLAGTLRAPRTVSPRTTHGHAQPTYANGRTRATEPSKEALKRAREASPAPLPGHILLTRGPSARGRRAPSEGGVMDNGTRVRLEPHEVALLRGGPRAAVTVAVLALHLRGAADAGRPGTVRVSGEPGGAGRALSALDQAVYVALRQPAGIRELSQRPAVRQEVAALRAGLVAAGLVRALPPRRTRAARRVLDALRAERPLPARRKDLPTADALFAVALYGAPALAALVPRFALRAGLTARAEVADKGLLRHSPRNLGGGGGHGCGDGGGSD